MPNFTTMDPVLVAIICAALVIVYNVYRRYTGISLTDVPGPVSPSFIMGTLPLLILSFADVAIRKHEGARPRAGRRD